MPRSTDFPLDIFSGEGYGRGPYYPSPMVVSDEKVLEQVLLALPCGWLVVDSHAQVSAVNFAALKLLRCNSPQLLHHPLLEVIPSWKRTRLAQILDAFQLHPDLPEPTELELPLGDTCWLRIWVTPMAGSAGEPSCLLLTLMEATESVKMRQQLRMAESRASVGKLARGIAHELNSPLDGVLRYTHLALEQLEEDAPLREYLLHVKEGLDRMVRAVRAFLEYSRQATIPVRRAARLNPLIEDALLLVRHRAEFQRVRIVTDLEDSSPLVWDAGLPYAIVNLVKNALDAMPQGGALSISAHRNGSAVELTVQDTGPGIPQEIHARIFEPFFSTKPIHQGNGLGLAMAKEAVERSGGSIQFTSQPGAGTQFVIRLGLAPSEGDSHNA